MYLIMELCNGGELSVKLREKTYFKEEVSCCVHLLVCMTTDLLLILDSQEAKAIMRKLTEAVVYMHDNGRDVPLNYLCVCY